MRYLLIRLVLVSMVALLPYIDLSATDADDLAEAFQNIKRSTLDPSTSAIITNFTIDHQDLHLVLDTGRIAFLNPVMIDDMPHVYAAYFEGFGQFSFSPSEKDARERILYYQDRDSVRVQFKKVLLVFSDDIYHRFDGYLKPCPKPFGKRQIKRVKKSWERLIRDDNNYYIFEILRNITEPPEEPYVLVNPQTGDWSKSFYYIYDPLVSEEVRLLKSTVRGPNFAQYLKTLCSYTCIATDSGQHCGELAEPQVRVRHYTIDASMSDYGDFECAVGAQFEVLKGPGQLLWMYIHQDAEIDSITSPEHKNVHHIRYEKDKNKSEMMYVILDNPMEVGDKFSLNFYYSAPLFWFSDRDLVGNLGSSWYPMYIDPCRSTYEITYEIPHFDDLKLVSTGKLVSSEKNGRRSIEKWEVTDPEYLVTFEFEEIKK